MSYIFKNLKITLLENDVIRFEYCPNLEFSNQESLFVANKRASFEELSFDKSVNINFTYKNFIFTFNENNPLNSLIVTKDGNQVYKFQDIKNSGELPLPNKTPEIFALMDSPRLLIPSEGYNKNNSGFILQKDVKDLYLLLADKDHLKLRKQYISLTGINEMPRLKTFGLFSSRYFKYNQQTAMKMIQAYEKHRIPLDTFILDTDWRDMEKLNGCGYTVNKKLFPDIQKFFNYAHNHNLQVMMNDHPLPLTEESQILDKEEIDYRHSNLTKFYNIGLDGWWYDRNWICHLNSIDENIVTETLGNYLFNDVTKQFYLGFTLDQDVYERSLVMSNINNIVNGKYEGILDSRSHRYALQWSGDINSEEQAISNEINNLKKCANNMIAYYSSDIGGHMGNPTKKQYIRWIEYGALSPIFRPHCTCNVKKFREPWNYDKTTTDIFRNYLNIRLRLLNVFYTAAYKNVNDGLGVCSPTYLYYPNDKKCYKESNAYMIGNSILVSPITDVSRPTPLLSSDCIGKIKLFIYPNKEFKGKVYSKLLRSFTEINKFYAKVKQAHPKTKEFSFRFKCDVKTKSESQLAITNDLESRVFINNKEVFNDFGRHYQTFSEFTKLSKNSRNKIIVETIQGRKLKNLNLLHYKVFKNEKTKIYLPEGEWFNLFHRNVYQGKRYIKERFKLTETPIFVKAGSLLPLYRFTDNISKMSLKNIVYDYYTSKKENIDDFFYEDDGKTTAYQIGEYRKNFYKTYFENNSYFIELKSSNKLLDDGIKFREVLFKVHARDNEMINEVLINNEPVKFKRHDHARKVLPFLDDKFAKDSKTVSFKFKQNLNQDYKIELKIKEKN